MHRQSFFFLHKVLPHWGPLMASLLYCHQATVMLPLLFMILFCLAVEPNNAEGNQLYIVYMGGRQHEDPEIVTHLHHEMLTKLLGSKEAALGSIVYSYKHGFSGFAAKLTESQAERVAGLPGVVHVMPSRTYELHTTRSWDFLGLSPGTPNILLSDANYGDGAIIGVIDTGIWPESESFNEEGLGPVPPRWKGVCQEGTRFNASNCNKKIIGARFFLNGISAVHESGQQQSPAERGTEFLSPRDANGHGTHTASTAAGSFVHNASWGGLGHGLARGGAPRARLAIYKACWGQGTCSSADMLAAFDSAISDGVDIISVSAGINQPPHPGYLETRNDISIGAFHAVARGITVVSSAGNSGPSPQKVGNTAPWIITVAASTVDRSFPIAITLGNNRTLIGQSIFSVKTEDAFRSIVYGGDVANSADSVGSSISCQPGSLNSSLVAGKVVLCFNGRADPNFYFRSAELTVSSAGGAAMIFAMHNMNILSTSTNSIPFAQVDYAIGTEIYAYIKASRNPTAKLSSPSSAVGRVTSPKVAAFSSRGPNSLSLDVLKPDIAAPGVDILAAWVEDVPYRFSSGTSMASPHVSGIAAMLKSLHPTWSPAAIKSALITTASTVDEYGDPIIAEGDPRKLADPFDYGGGHVNPNKAADPGLIHDMAVADHVQFLCSIGYSNSTIKAIAGFATSCESRTPIYDLNLPSISISNLKETTTVARTVTNVGDIDSTYRAIVEAPSGVKMTVDPSVLCFNEIIKSASFKVTFLPLRKVQGDFSFGSLSWTDGKHVVRIPVAVRVVIQDSYADIS